MSTETGKKSESLTVTAMNSFRLVINTLKYILTLYHRVVALWKCYDNSKFIKKNSGVDCQQQKIFGVGKGRRVQLGLYYKGKGNTTASGLACINWRGGYKRRLGNHNF